MDKDSAIILTQSKNMGLGVVLTLFFGGFGLFYASIVGGILMTLAELLSLALCFVVIGFFMLPVVHIVSLVWTILAINGHNKKLLAQHG